MATTIESAIARIKDELDSHFDKQGLRWKTQESQTVHTQARPTVFAMVCAERNARNFPVVCPSVTVELREVMVESTNRITLDIACHCVVVNSAIIEREKTVMLDDGIHYGYLNEDGYTDAGVVEALFADCLLLGEETLNALRGVPGVSDLALEPPSTMDDYPYCQCRVTGMVSMLSQHIENEFL